MARYHRLLHPDFPIHVTARSNNREKFPLPLEEMWEILSDHLFLLRHSRNIRIRSFVLMPNHFHMICMDPDMNLPAGMEYFMRETSREIGRRSGRINKIWGGPYHTSIMSDPRYVQDAYKYVYRNPVAAGLCTRVEEYGFSSLRILLGFERGIIPLVDDGMIFSRRTEETLEWLNQENRAQQNLLIRAALRKRNFEFAKQRGDSAEFYKSLI